MAYNRTASAPQSNDRRDFEPAKAFYNIYVARRNPDGSVGRTQLVGIPLRDGNATEKTLLEWMLKDPANQEKLLSKLTGELKLVGGNAGTLMLED